MPYFCRREKYRFPLRLMNEFQIWSVNSFFTSKKDVFYLKKLLPLRQWFLTFFCSMDPSKSKKFPRTPRLLKRNTGGPLITCKRGSIRVQTLLLWSSRTPWTLSTDPRLRTYALRNQREKVFYKISQFKLNWIGFWI